MGEVLQPGVQIKPVLTVNEAKIIAEKVFGIYVESIKELDAYDDKNYYIKVQFCSIFASRN
jgi:hydroxylysine kinase